MLDERMFMRIIYSIIVIMFIYIPYSYADDYQVKVEEVRKCGYIFEFLPNGDIICATRGDGEGEFKTATISILRKFKDLSPIAKIDEVYLGDIPTERGFVGLQIDPDFVNNPYVYVTYTYKDDNNQEYRKVVRFEYKDDENGTRLINPKLLLTIPSNDIHNGGPMEFGYDGLLYITNGDTSKAGEWITPKIRDGKPVGNVTEIILSKRENITRLEGKILRIDRDGNIPKDNPIPNSPIYTFGHRNVWGIAFHPITKQPFITENGPATDDEINILYKGKDYGWPVALGYKILLNETYFAKYNFNASNYVMPIWSNGGIATAPTQMLFYTGNKYKEFTNNLFFLTIHDASLHRIVLAPPDYTKIVESYVYPLYLPVVTDIEIDENGDIYVSALSERKIYKVSFEKVSHKERENTTIIFDNSNINEVNKTITFTARLLDSNGKPLVYMPINFRLDDYIIGTVRTDNNGYAKLGYHFTSPNKHIIKAEFNGDDTYSYASAMHTFAVIDAKRLTKYEFLIDDNVRGRLLLSPIENDKINVDEPIIAIVEFIDNNNSIINAEYDFTIINGNNDILLTEKGNTNSNIHLYKFEENENIKIMVRYDGKDIVLKYTVIPEFASYSVYIITFIILLTITFAMKHISIKSRYQT